MATGYTREYSKYVLRSTPTATKKGYVYENDLTTVNSEFSTLNNTLFAKTDGGFGYVLNASTNDSKSYDNSGWSQKKYTLNDISIKDTDFENKDNSNNSIKKQKYVKINKEYTYLSDYCYFGSCNAMLKAAIDDIILRFPAAICVKTIDSIIYNGNIITIDISDTGNTDNKFFMDLFDYYPQDINNMNYDLRTIKTSYLDYEAELSDGTSIGKVIGFTGYTSGNTNKISFNIENGGIIQTYNNLLSLYIKPNTMKIDEFFDSLDDFQNVILNRNSIPKYKSYFVIPVENEYGITYEYKSFIWPTTDGYNIDIDLSSYSFFIQELIDVTNTIDELYNDNLYRMLTHDSIKNLDTTFKQTIDEEELEDIIIGGTKVQKILRLYGRSFDELKKYIEGISFANTITYNNEDNLPSEYLDTKVSVLGWDSFSVMNEITSSTVSNMFPGSNKSYSPNEIENFIRKQLILNSKDIFKSKGTKKSIRKLLGLLGFEDNWYEIREYVQKIDTYLDKDYLENIASLNYSIYPENYDASDGKDPYVYSYNENLFENTNVGIFSKCPVCGSENYYISGDTYGEDNTAICLNDNIVFDITGNSYGYPKPLTNSDNYYFQQKGNWYRETGGVHTTASGDTYVNEITYGNNPHIGNGEYDNGYDYVNQFEDIFKRFHRNAGESNVPPIINYLNKGFTVSSKKIIDNTKISYINDINTGVTNNDNRLILNTKNFVIGLNTDNIKESFYSKCAQETINSLGFVYTPYNINGGNLPDVVQIYAIAGNTFIKVNNSNIKTGTYSKIHNSLESDFNIQVTGGTNLILLPGETLIINKTGSTVSVYKDESDYEYNILKSIAFPYLEQIIPSTTIFDIVKINKTPKWLLVDEYCQRFLTVGNFTGYKILAFQNINYFDNKTLMPDDSLTGSTGKIIADFGTGYTYLESNMKEEIIKTTTGYTHTNNYGGFDNIYLFTKPSNECGLNTNPYWVVDNNLI